MEVILARIEFVAALAVTGIVILLVLAAGTRHFFEEWLPWLPNLTKGIGYWIRDSKPEISKSESSDEHG